MKNLLYIVLILLGTFSYSQVKPITVETPNHSNGVKVNKVETEEDSLIEKKFMLIDNEVVEAIDLDEVFLIGPYKFENRDDRRQYLILQRKTKHVWPYAVTASNRLIELNERLSKIKSKSKRKKYTRIVQNYIEEEFTEELKKLTKTEGQILVKLMYRQTGTTTFDVVKELKSGWRAFWYNTTASMFNISLKEEYHPEQVKEDFLIEHILRRCFQKKRLDKQEPAIHIDFLEAVERWQ